MSYERVLPRDLFNEAKLLKCLGRLTLLIHDGMLHRWPMKVIHTGECFDVRQRSEDGGLWCSNVSILVGSHEIDLYTVYNDKDPYPMLFAEGDHGNVFNDDGTLAQEFTDWLEGMSWSI